MAGESENQKIENQKIKMTHKKQKLIYADHSATTQVRKEVLEIMLPCFDENFGNPSSIHSYGRKAKHCLEDARKNIASVINADERQIVFTSGGTESDNLVISGVSRLVDESVLKKDKHIITSKIEHPAIKEPLEYLEKKGWNITWINVDKEGFIDFNELKRSITVRTSLVSIIHANNEIGTIQDLKQISEICKKNNVLFHTDAVQSFGKIPIDVKDLNIDFLSMSSHKIYGPKGAGALYIKDIKSTTSIFCGGGQEYKIRPGTENLPAIIGFSYAAKLINSEMELNAKYLRELQLKLMKGLSEIKNIILTGVDVDKITENIPNEKYLYRIPGHVSICCKNIDGESLVLQADLRGIACSSGSACKNNDTEGNNFEPSHVLQALMIPCDYNKGSLRFTLGKENTMDDVKYIIESMTAIVETLNKKALLAS